MFTEEKLKHTGSVDGRKERRKEKGGREKRREVGRNKEAVNVYY